MGDASRLSHLIAKPFHAVWRDMRAGGHSEYWLAGGRGSGKSSFAAVAVVMTVLLHPGANALVYRKIGATLRESVYAQVGWAIDRLGLDGLFSRSLSPMEMTYLPTGQRVLFRGLDDPAKSKSIKLREGYFGALWMEEASELGGLSDVRTVQLSVLRGEGRAMTILTYNPPISARAWINLKALTPDPARLVHQSTYLDLPPEWLGEGFLSQARRLAQSDERAYRHVFLGVPTGAGGQVFGNLRLSEVTDEEIRGFDRICWGLDFGFACDPDALVAAGYDRKRSRLVLLAERVARGLSADALANMIFGAMESLGVSARDSPVCCDSADPRMIAQLRHSGVLAVGASKGAGSVLFGVKWLSSLRELAIDPARCPVAAREFSTCEYRRVGDEFLPELCDRDNHTIDALRYATQREADRRVATMRG